MTDENKSPEEASNLLHNIMNASVKGNPKPITTQPVHTLPLPWIWDDTDYVPELINEMPVGHYLYNKNVESIARRQDRDDVLFKIMEGETKYAVVHLTYNKETNPQWPHTTLYNDWDDLYTSRILKDAEGWE
jgi:hypothetical protein